METLFVILIITVAGLLLIRHFYRNIQKRKPGCACEMGDCTDVDACNYTEKIDSLTKQ